MKTLVEVDDMVALEAHVRAVNPWLPADSEIEVVPYWQSRDERTGWHNTAMVRVAVIGTPLGFCELPES